MKTLFKKSLTTILVFAGLAVSATASPTRLDIPGDNAATESAANGLLDQWLTANGATPANPTDAQMEMAVSESVSKNPEMAPEIVIVAVRRMPPESCVIPKTAINALDGSALADRLYWTTVAALNHRMPHAECPCHLIIAALDRLDKVESGHGKAANEKDFERFVQLATLYDVDENCLENILAAIDRFHVFAGTAPGLPSVFLTGGGGGGGSSRPVTPIQNL